MMHLEALKSLVPHVNIIDEARLMAGYVSGVRGEQGAALAVVRPKTTQEARDVVKALKALGIPFHPQGGNTGLVGASVPDDTGTQVVISTDLMREVFEIDIENRSLRVSAGFTLSDVNTRLAEHHLQFPIDLGANPHIGGMVATNTGGGRFLRYGDVRRNVLGVTMATKAGEVARLGSNVRKTNMGTDWKHLAIGSAGAFGIITEAILNLEPVPRQKAVALVMTESSDAVFPLLTTLEHMAGPMLTAFEFMSREALEVTFEHSPSLRNPFSMDGFPEFALLIELTRPNPPKEWESPIDDVLQKILMEIWESGDVPISDALFGPPEDSWALRHAVSEGVRKAGKLYAFDLGFRRPDVLRFRTAIRKDLAEEFPTIKICDFGHVGDGGLHFNLVGPVNGHSDAFEAQLRDLVVQKAVEEFGASFSAEHGIGPKNQKYADAYSPKTTFFS